MPISAGDRLGPYEILAPIGEGGMGEVYRARDTKLKRDVAIKILPDAFARDPGRMVRFQREAEVLASLNHPNIAAIYGIEDRALVMELVPGECLKGPVPLETALKCAKQIADALQAAHDIGIVHRDLKPANIMITPQGVVKVLDFGLAKLTASVASSGDSVKSPTLTMGATEAGLVLGTAAYMAPEQARGQQDVDRRADIWAFGVVLYEILTGKQLFGEGTISDILASVLKVEPDLQQAPAKMRPLLRSCLQKEPLLRLQAIGDWALLVGDTPTPASSRTTSHPEKLGIVAATLLTVVAAIAGWGWWRSTRPVYRPLMRLSVDLGPDAVASAGITVAISPDGTRLVFPVRGKDGTQQLATRLLDETAATVLPGTEGASDPFFSPDGRWAGFFTDSKMKKISVLGGAPVTLCDAFRDWGASWGQDGNIIAALNSSDAGLSRIPAAGGTPQKLTGAPGIGGVTHRWPQILPGGDTVVFTASATNTNFQYATVEVLSLRTGERKTLMRDAYFGRYFPDGRSGYLLYIHDGALFAALFDQTKLQVRGTPVLLLEDLAGDPASGSGQFDFAGALSRSGAFVYRSGNAPGQMWPVEWLESSGKTSPLLAMPAAYFTPRFSPDGQRLALSVGVSKGRDLFVYDWRHDAMLRLTFAAPLGNLNSYPVWMPDAKHIVYRSAPSSGGSSIEWLRADGSGTGLRLFESKSSLLPYSFSTDGRLLAYAEQTSETGTDLWTRQLDLTDPDHPKAGKPDLFLRTPSNEVWPFFSPDGRWIAYASDQSGGWEIYVRSFSPSGGPWQISRGGGMYPMWSRTGRELFYQTLDNRIMVADYAVAGTSFVAGKPHLWSNTLIRPTGPLTNLDLFPDGKRFAIFPQANAPAEGGSVQMTFLLNFVDEVRRRLPAGR